MLSLAARIPAAKNDANISETIEADAALAAALENVERAIKLTEQKKKFLGVRFLAQQWDKKVKETNKRGRDEDKADAKRRALDDLRTRKCEPGLKIEWHGGKGFGGPQLKYIKLADGKYISAAQAAAKA